MSTLKQEPPQAVQSMEELFAIAYSMEQEAANRYSQIAAILRIQDNPALAEIFERLAAQERLHLEGVIHWSEQQKGTPPDPAHLPWQVPETFDDEGAGTMDPRVLTAYRSLAMAVRNEERAFAFWTYVAAHAEQREVRRAAEAMAAEELEHVAILRRERRLAYHQERGSAAGQLLLEIDIADLESHLSDRLGKATNTTRAQDAAGMQRFALEARKIAEELRREPLASAQSTVWRGAVPDEIVALSSLLVDRYLEAAENLNDEKSVARAQALAARAINRLTWLRADVPEIGAGS
jgi:rubrerythrin